ncbi:hypothetical protein MMC18_004524 [Xylographa bjoerkii]|nr:hypothetical protein [Xylographa bjoerkii]
MSNENMLPDRGRVLFYTKYGGPKIHFSQAEEKSQAEIEDYEAEEERKALDIEDNLDDLNEDETTDADDDINYDSDDTDAGFISRRPKEKEQETKEDNDDPLEQTQHYALSDLGKEFLFRGKGPEGGNNTASMDCTLMIARMLRIGGLLDRGEHAVEADFVASLAPFHAQFYQEMAYNHWDTNSAEANKQNRNILFDDFLFESQRLRRDELIPFPIAWELCTSFSPQLQFKTTILRQCVHCNADLTDPITPEERQRVRTNLELNATTGNAKERTTMQEILQREFGPQPPKGTHVCIQGSDPYTDAIQERLVVLEDLPATLAVIPHAQYRNIESATADLIHFNYLSESGERRATYKWMGGAYQSHSNHRVYWTDDDTLNAHGLLKIYDPLQANGIIVGGVPPDHYENKIVDYWARECAMLFYECVLVEPPDPVPPVVRTGENNSSKRRRTDTGLGTSQS